MRFNGCRQPGGYRAFRSHEWQSDPRLPYLAEAMTFVPLLRALAVLRTCNPIAAGSLVRRTIAKGSVEHWRMPPRSEFLALLLARQRAIFVDSGASAVGLLPRPECSAGTSVIWARLQAAMNGLLDVEREVLFLIDGAACSGAVLAFSLGCGEAQIRDLVCTARAELIVQLQSADDEGGGPDLARRLPDFDSANEIAFIRHLNVALYQALQHDVVDPLRRQVLHDMIEDEIGQLAQPQAHRDCGGRSCMTRWLRLMYIAYTQDYEALQ